MQGFKTQHYAWTCTLDLIQKVWDNKYVCIWFCSLLNLAQCFFGLCCSPVGNSAWARQKQTNRCKSMHETNGFRQKSQDTFLIQSPQSHVWRWRVCRWAWMKIKTPSKSCFQNQMQSSSWTEILLSDAAVPSQSQTGSSVFLGRASGHSDASFARLAIKPQLFALASGDVQGNLAARGILNHLFRQKA